MSFFKNFIKSTIIGSLILVPVLIFIYFTQGYVSNYNFVIGSVGYFIATMQNMGPIYVIIICYLTGMLAQFFSRNLTFNSID
ncbi:MAG: hypothetical protein CMD49_04535 [Gammaproteobacteria bacterium]|nr:hypothetical protein [Gammaproteobacteria bacterium]